MEVTGVDRVNREITRIMDHVGLNPDETLTVETTLLSYRLTSRIRGVDLELARAALTVYLLERAWIELAVEDDSLVLVQWDR